MNYVFDKIYYPTLDFIKYFIDVIHSIPHSFKRKNEIIEQMSKLGVDSIPIIVFATTFAGIVATGEIAFHMNISLNTVEMIPGVSGQFIFRELGIAIPALLMVSKVGASIAAEVSTMKVTDQIDAMKMLRVNPIEVIVIPRFIASTIVVSCITLISIFVTVLFATLFAVLSYNFSFYEYLNAMTPFLHANEVLCALIKGAVFGMIIPLISCFYGFRCKAGAIEVGMTTTSSVVNSTVCVILFDFLLSYIFSNIL